MLIPDGRRRSKLYGFKSWHSRYLSQSGNVQWICNIVHYKSFIEFDSMVHDEFDRHYLAKCSWLIIVKLLWFFCKCQESNTWQLGPEASMLTTGLFCFQVDWVWDWNINAAWSSSCSNPRNPRCPRCWGRSGPWTPPPARPQNKRLAESSSLWSEFANADHLKAAVHLYCETDYSS